MSKRSQLRRLFGGSMLAALVSPLFEQTLARLVESGTLTPEAAAVLRAAEAHTIGFGVIKAISDESDFDFPETGRFVDSEGRFSEINFALFVALRPWLWRRVWCLARNSNQASRSLCSHLRQLCTQETASPTGMEFHS